MQSEKCEWISPPQAVKHVALEHLSDLLPKDFPAKASCGRLRLSGSLDSLQSQACANSREWLHPLKKRAAGSRGCEIGHFWGGGVEWNGGYATFV